MKEWKKYVNYYRFIKVKQCSDLLYDKYKPSYFNFPGPITNKDLLVPLNEFLNDGDPDNPENEIIKDGLKLDEDFRIVNKDIWDLFYNMYGGGPLVSQKRITFKSNYVRYTKDRSYKVNNLINFSCNVLLFHIGWI